MSRDVNEPILDVSRDVIEPISVGRACDILRSIRSIHKNRNRFSQLERRFSSSLLLLKCMHSKC